MNKLWFSEWEHVFKLDPDKEISDEALDAICMSGTDAIIVGGSSGVTFENTVDLLSRIRRYEVECTLEVSTLEGAVPGFDGYFIPFVMNAGEAEWILQKQLEGLKEYGIFIPWELTAGQAYIILNENSTAARISNANTNMTANDLSSYIWLSDRLFHLPIVYIEYSGMFGDMEMLRTASNQLKNGQLFYGGGIDDAKKAAQAAQLAQTVVVGNIIYENLDKALETVRAVKDVKQANQR